MTTRYIEFPGFIWVYQISAMLSINSMNTVNIVTVDMYIAEEDLGRDYMLCDCS